MEYILIGITVFFNIIIVIWKLEKQRYLDGLLDGFLLILVTIVFSGSYGALVVGTVASALVSLYLLIWPPQMPNWDL